MKRRRYARNERHCENDIVNNIINHMQKSGESVDPQVFLALSRMDWQKETLGTFPLSSHVRSNCFLVHPPEAFAAPDICPKVHFGHTVEDALQAD